jgi:hypothetical protein
MSMPDREESRRYEQLVALEESESLLEEVEEQSLTGSNPGEHIPEELRQRMTRLGVRDVQQLRDHIMRLHALFDDSDDDLTITES